MIGLRSAVSFRAFRVASTAMPSRTSDLVRAAVEIARTAGQVAAERFAAGTTASLKPDGTELTRPTSRSSG